MKTPLNYKEPIPDHIRWSVWERDNFTCHYCGARAFLSIDHVTPESKGGTLALTNLVTSCRSCNSKKHTRDYAEFRIQTDLLDARRRVFWSHHEYREAVSVLREQAETARKLATSLSAECELRFGCSPDNPGDERSFAAD